ncbi:carbonic anhydrase 2 [Fusarium coicis]|nr:carbonic anhydrase 2 [Fusarium coicis]
MGKAKSAADALRLGSERSAVKESNIVNGDLVHRTLQPAVERNYKKMMEFWLEYQRIETKASVHDLESLKDFMRKVAYGIDGEDAEDQEFDVPGWETVRKYWNAFTAAWQRAHPTESIPRGIAQSVTEFIKGPLATEMGMPKHKRRRRFATKNVMLNYARQLWAADWIEHKCPATPVDDWGLLLGNTYSSSRIGEYIESSCRAGTGRGLYFKPPNKRPQHALYEDNEAGLLCFNPMLPFLARILAHGAFRDYRTIDDLLAITPPEGEMWVIQWKDHLLDTPFFRSQPGKDIETAGAFSHRLRLLGLRAGYPTPPRHHDIRAEGLHLMNQFESEATRMVYAGHTDPNTLATHYLPRNGADGQAAYHGQERRTLVLDLFRGLTIPRNPRLWQCLPAKEQHDFDNSPEIININQELLRLRGSKDKGILEYRKKLYTEKRKRIAERLRKWQKNQPVKHDDPLGYHRAIFERVRFLMPERDRLSQNLFVVDKLRSPAGLAVLHDMLALYQKRRNVEYRPGLEPEKCQCKDNGSTYDWRHVYDCYKTASAEVDGFSELCFLCNEWFCGIRTWEAHCQHHLDHPNSLPTWCDPLTYGGVLARAGYCPFCLGDERMQASTRMYQFQTRWTWLNHIQNHIEALTKSTVPLKYPRQHGHCPGYFDSVLDLQFHLQDAFGVKRSDDDKSLKRPRHGDDDIPRPKVKKVRHYDNESEKKDEMNALQPQHDFHNTYLDDLKQQPSPRLTGLSQESTPFYSSSTTDYVDAAPSRMYVTLSLSVTSNTTNECVRTSINDSMNVDAPSQEIPAGRANQAPEDVILPSQTDNGKESITRVPQQDTHGQQGSDRTLSLDQEGVEFDVEKLVAKGRIGKRVWYKVKWKGYPESDNSWVKKKDIGTGAVGIYEARHPHGQGTFCFERIVSKQAANGNILYEVKWQGQEHFENIWVDKWDLGNRAILAFEAGLST